MNHITRLKYTEAHHLASVTAQLTGGDKLMTSNTQLFKSMNSGERTSSLTTYTFT